MDLYNKLKSKVKVTLNDKNNKSRTVEKEATKEEAKVEKKAEKKVQTKVENDEGPLESVCLLFPTYATKNPNGIDGDQWNIRIRGWAFSAPKKSKMRSLFLELSSFAIQKDDERFQYLESRTSYFWARNLSQGEFTVQVDGLTGSSKMSIEGDPIDEEPTATREITGMAKSIPDVNDVKEALDQAISTLSQSVGEIIRTTIIPKSGHFYGDLSIPKETVAELIGKVEDNSKNVATEATDNNIGSGNKIKLLKVKVHREGSEPRYGVVSLIEPEGVSVISDIDDTIKDTDILQGAKRVLSNTFLQPFKDVPGMADVYRKFYDHGASIHYVSNSPWQLFPSLRSFFQTYNFPPGSAHFKFYDGLIKSAYQQKENPMASKFMYIRELLKDFPKRKFILIGDTGELDPEIYTTIARENPGRILRIYVRDVTTEHVKDLPPAKPKYSYTRTFPRMYNYLRNYYSAEEDDVKTEASSENKEESEVTQGVEVAQEEAAADTSSEATTEGHTKPERKQTLPNRILDKLHVDVSYLYGTATSSPDSTDSDSPKTNTNKPKAPLSARILSPSRAAAISSKFSKLRHLKSGKSDDKSSDDKTSDDKTSDDKTSDDKTSDDKSSDDKSSDIKVPEEVEADDDDDKDNKVLKTPLEMFHERIELLGEGLPDGLFHAFTDVTELENDPVIRAELKY